MKKLALGFLLTFLFAVIATAAVNASVQPGKTGKQNAGQQAASSKAKRNTIRGRVVDESGQAMPFLDVRLIRQSGGANINSNPPIARTDENGRFEFTNLTGGNYSMFTSILGYYHQNPTTEARPIRVGDEVTLTMVKGGVITGTVRNAAGELVPEVQVRTFMVRDAEGKPVARPGVSGVRQTDDRGIFRIFGLRPGVYLVAAGGLSTPSVFGEEVQTYYPSSTRDTAAEVIVAQGQETSGIDLALRDGKAHVVSGQVTNVPEEAMDGFVQINMMRAASGVMEFNTGSPIASQGAKFEVRGVEDGEYLLTARLSWPGQQVNPFASDPVRVKVRGADVTGLKVNLAPLSSIAGRVVLEKPSDPKMVCEGKQEAFLEEIMVVAARDTKSDPPDFRWLTSRFSSGLEDGGTFQLRMMNAGRYRFSANLPSENWYIRTLTLGGAGKGRQLVSQNAQQIELANGSLSLKAGGRIDGLTFFIIDGGASVRGKVIAASESDKLPSRLQVYLVPAERERAADPLRYAHADLQNDGSFSLLNLAPGKYWLLTKEVTTDELNSVVSRPLYWDTTERLALRKEAEAENAAIVLQACQQVKEFRLRHKIKNSTVTPAVSKD